ncbi:MAG: methyltransferase [Gammaproteobacteria bacterium]|nr:methyltransferase [Gammaproteobacteria bacterium]
MKVNTDGILLGAWSLLPSSENKAFQHIIDIGTGTGLIALMLAQKKNSIEQNAKTRDGNIDAIEIDEAAAEQARFNVAHSPWPEQINIIKNDIKLFAQQSVNHERYDLLVSNPPYFSDSLLGPNTQRNLARHNNQLSFSELLSCAFLLASKKAVFNLILPINEAQRLLSLCEKHHWYVAKLTEVSSVVGKPATRLLLSLQKVKPSELQRCSFAIRDTNNLYTEEYKALCKDFYLKF